MASMPRPDEHEPIILTNFIVSEDIERSIRFYTEILGGELAMSIPGGPAIVQLANGWITISTGGGPTDDKPEVTLEVPASPSPVSAFLNIRVADISAVHGTWTARGAHFLTDPIDHGHEIRCYLRDPDGHLIEVGQAAQQ